MSPKIVNFEIILIYFLLLIPWPHTQVIKLLCSRDNSRLVRKIVRSKWTPILDKYQVKLPLECPLHPFRDVFAPRQDAKKRDRPTQWTCRKCGKSFYQEKFLDLHFETRHRSIVNRDEDAVCLADFCDIMRCEVFQSEESTRLNTGDSHIITDIEVWGDSLGQNSALAKANAAYLSLIPLRTSAIGASRAAKVQQGRQLCQDKVGQTKFKDSPKDPHHVEKTDHAERPKSTNDSSKKRAGSGSSPSGFSAATGSRSQGAKTDPKKGSPKKLPASNRSDQEEEEEEEEEEDSVNGESGNGDEGANNGNTSSNGNRTQNGNGQNMQKVRANCRAEELSKLKAKCEYLVRNCIAGLLLSMTDHAFKEMEEEMNKAVCWYLSCDRYWEDGPLEPRAFPWGLIVILIFVLSTGICFCYYIIWILFDSEESTINANHQPYLHHQQPHGGGMGGGHGTGAYPQHYYYQQQQQPEDLYPELPRYDYRHSPRRYNERTHQQQQQQQQQQHQPQHQQSQHQQHQPQHHQQQHQQQPQQHGTPTTTGSGHGAQSAAYQQDIFDRRDYTNRTTIPTTAVTGGGGVGSTSASGSTTTGMGNAKASGSHMNLADVVSEANAVNLATMIGGGGGGGGIGGIDGQRHYTPNQSSSSLHHHHHQLEPHHRHTGASQTSLRGSSSSHEIIQSDVGHNEHYIYVTYPPDLKKRYFDKYE